MDPLSRKLFKTRDAREKLRSMGGIMSSSSQLAATVQKFRDGGDIAPTIAPVQMNRGRSTNIGSTIFTLLPSGLVVDARTGEPASPSETLSVHRKLQVFPVTDPIQVGSGVNPSFAYDESMRDLGIGIVPERLRPYGADSFMDSFIPGTDEPIPAEARTAGGLRPALDLGLRGGRSPVPPPVADEQEPTGDPREPMGFFELLGRSSGAARQTPEDIDEMALRSAEEAAKLREERGITQSLTEPASVVDTGTGPTTRSGPRREEEKTPPPNLDPEKPETFETTYAQMLQRLEGVMGKKDVDSRKKAMANLAMIGLAIASGQSPNALTNIAQGALSGVQAIRSEEASREEQERAVRMVALKGALDLESGVRSAEAETARDERKFQQEQQLEILKAGLKGQGGQEVSPLDPFAESVLKVAGDMITNEGGDYTEAVRKAYGIVQNLPGYSGMNLPPVESLLIQPAIKTRIDQALSQGADPAKIKADLEAQFPGIDSSLYGL